MEIENEIEGAYKRLQDINQESNLQKEMYYEGRNIFKNLRIGIPKALEGLKISVAWAEIVVESLASRINLDGVITESPFLKDQVIKNNFKQTVKLAVRDQLIFGTSYLLAQPGESWFGEPEVLITAESPLTTYGETNRLGQLQNLLLVHTTSKKTYEGTYITPNTTYAFESDGKNLYITGTDEHNLGYVPAVKLVNQPRASRRGGKSEIDHSTRTMIDEAIRSYFGAATAREFYAAPQRYLLNVDLSQFKDKDGRPIESWQAYMGKMLLGGTNKDKTSPVVGQFNASSPEPFLELVKQYAREVSAAKGIPVSDLGYQSSQPPSAESMEQQYSRLVKRAEDTIVFLDEGVKRILLMAAGVAGEDSNVDIMLTWRNPRITSLGSLVQADGVQKLVSAGVLQPDSDVVYNFLGLDGESVEVVRNENRTAKALNIAALAKQLGDTGSSVQLNTDTGE